jgi:hypothetical protein
MKPRKQNKHPKKEHEGVETPPPPQVMDPSAVPENQQKIDKAEGEGKRASKKNKNSKNEKLSPKDEL